MLLSIVTVVRNDPEGLSRTLESVSRLPAGEFEHWVVDGSTDDRVRALLHASKALPGLQWISEPDEGLYDAMNKGLERAKGDYALFVNAGDVISPLLDTRLLFGRLRRAVDEGTGEVLIGHTVETWDEHKWLRPGLGREEQVFIAPPHQATFYPRGFYSSQRYRLDIRVAADCDYTDRAIQHCGADYLPATVCEFELGGLSSNYGRLSALRLRFRETNTPGHYAKLLTKIILWRLLPRGAFYNFLAAGKYTRLSGNSTFRLNAGAARRRPPQSSV